MQLHPPQPLIPKPSGELSWPLLGKCLTGGHWVMEPGPGGGEEQAPLCGEGPPCQGSAPPPSLQAPASLAACTGARRVPEWWHAPLTSRQRRRSTAVEATECCRLDEPGSGPRSANCPGTRSGGIPHRRHHGCPAACPWLSVLLRTHAACPPRHQSLPEAGFSWPRKQLVQSRPSLWRSLTGG